MNDPRADVVLSAPDMSAALDALGRAGFSVEMILPADDPEVAVVSGHGVRVRLVRGPLPVAIETAPAILAPSFVVTRSDERGWKVGRARMQYRDLIPDRQGGRFVASHIRIPVGGPVPDYVHFHDVRFQMIHCYKGWVRLVYEDQGPPFVLSAGETVLQPPKIRHRVLECSSGLEVIEIGSPAVHATFADHETALPSPIVRADRAFERQRFVWNRSPGAHSPFPAGAAEQYGARDIATASDGVVSARVRRSSETLESTHDAELFFGFVLAGAMSVTCEGVVEALASGDAFVIPRAKRFLLEGGTPDLAWLEVTTPAAFGCVPTSGQ